MQRVEYVVVGAPLWGGAFNEDACVVSSEREDKPFFAAVVDGHGQDLDTNEKRLVGSKFVAEFAQATAQCLSEGFRKTQNVDRLPELFSEVDQELEVRFGSFAQLKSGNASLKLGAVASCVALSDQELVCAQAGDCRLYRDFGGPQGFMLLTQDHNAHRPLEVRRLDPFVRTGKFRVEDLATPKGFPPTKLRLYQVRGRHLYGGLRPTRGFGNWDYRPAFTSEPEVRRFVLAKMPACTLFALCTDGANVVVENVMRRLRGRTRQLTTEELASETSSRLLHPYDDATVVYFRVKQ